MIAPTTTTTTFATNKQKNSNRKERRRKIFRGEGGEGKKKIERICKKFFMSTETFAVVLQQTIEKILNLTRTKRFSYLITNNKQTNS